MPATLLKFSGINDVVADARDLPSLVATLQQADPVLAQQITGKALFASRSFWGNFLVPGVAYAAGRYGLGWDHDTCAIVAGGILVVTSAVLRYMTTSPITSWVRRRVGV
jgi:hypothetical protein